MKKFFKKVSLVLAFALVLGSADHATVAKAAETWKFQSAAETLYLGSQTVGADTFDFNFVGAPAGYTTSNTFAWSSSDPKVATVAAGGIVTAKANGKTTITCRISNKTTGLLTATASATVTVRTIEHATKVEIYNAADSTKTPITSAKLTVGETIDLNRQLTNAAGVVSAAGQATNTASTDKTAFKSNNESVATVDASTGVVTAVKAGTATITAYTYDVKDANQTAIKTATVTVTVAADASYTAKQTTVDAFTITFENDVTFDPSKLQVVKIFEQDGIKEEINTYVKETKQSGKDVKVTLYFEFDAEATDYKVVYDGIEQHFVAEIGKAVNVVIKSTLNDDELYIYNSDITASSATDIIVYPVDANGIDVSNQYADLAFNLETAEEVASVGEATDAKNTASIAIGEEATDGQAIVVTGTFVVDADQDEKIEFSKVFYAKKAPTQRIISAVGYYVDDQSGANTNDKDTLWSNTSKRSVALDDENASGMYLHVMLKDNYGNLIFSGDDTNGKISFASANPDKLLVDETSNEIKTIAAGSAIPVVVYWTSPATSTTQKAKAVAIVPVTVTLKRTVTKVTSKVDNPTVASVSTAVTGADESLVTITVLDNYDAKFNPTKIVAYTKDKACKYSAESPLVFAYSEDGIYTATVEADMFELATGTNSKTFNFTVYVNDKAYSSANFSVKIADPSKGTAGWLVTASEVDLTVNKNTTNMFTYGIGNTNADATVGSDIKVYLTKNGVKVQEIKNIFPWVNAAKAAEVINTVSDGTGLDGGNVVSTNQIYFYDVVLNGNPVTEKSHNTDGTVIDTRFCAVATGTPVNGSSAFVRDTLAAGNYTVRLYRANKDQSTVVSKMGGTGTSCTMVVKNNSGVLSMEATNIDLTVSDIKDAAMLLFNFKYSDPANNDYVNLNTGVTPVSGSAQFSAKGKKVGEYVYIESVTVTYQPSSSAEAVQKKFTINKTYPVVKND